jgi:CHAT domain-containing protein
LKTPGTRQLSFRLWGTLGLLLVAAGGLGVSIPHHAPPGPKISPCTRAPILPSGTSPAFALAPGQVQAFHVWRERGQVLDVSVDQRRIDVVVELWSPREKELVVADDRVEGKEGAESIYAVASERGNYCLTVQPREGGEYAASYHVDLAAPREATDLDRLRATGQQAYLRGEQLRASYQYRDAIAPYQEAVRDFRKLGDLPRLGASFFALARAYQNLGEVQKECESLRSAASVWSGTHREAAALNLLGLTEYDHGSRERGLAFVLQAQEIAHRLGNDHLRAGIDNNLAIVYEKRGDVTAALSTFEMALREWRAEKDFHQESLSLINLAEFLLSVGQAERALAAAREAVTLSRKNHDLENEGSGLRAEGRALATLGQSAEALVALGSALRLSRQTGDLKDQVFVLLAIGFEQLRAQSLAQAHQTFIAALAVAQDRQNDQLLAGALAGLGEVAGLTGHQASGLEDLARAKALYEKLFDRESVAATLDARARILARAGQPREALAEAEKALPLLEALRLRPGSTDLRSSFLASHHGTFELDIELRMQLRDAAGAFAMSERARARAILDELTEARVEIRNGADSALLQKQAELENRLVRLEARQAEEANLGQGAGPLATEVEGVSTDLQVIEANIRTGSPKYTSLVQPAPLTVEAAQRQLLDESTDLLAYSLGDEHSYLWLIRRGSLTFRQLPPRKTIEELASAAYKLLSQPPQRREQTALERILKELGHTVLGPIATELGQDRLLIVADGALQTIPFGVLPVSAPGGRGEHPLLVDHEIVNLPSASVLALLREEIQHRPRPGKQVAVLGDPVFGSDDLRLPVAVRRAPGVSPVSPLADLARSARDLGIHGFDRLPSSGAEAEAILRLVSPGQGLKALGFDANRKLATGGELGHYQVVHFATHAVVDLVHPELSGIVLSLLDSEGKPQDGFLRAYEIYNLSLPVDLVVLSACRTAVGPEIRGEGLSALTRGFMYAGASRVLVSLWNVSDRGTARLMERFYQNFLHQKMRPAAALRAAQLEMLQDAGWKAPYYWAGFVLQGEWR